MSLVVPSPIPAPARCEARPGAFEIDRETSVLIESPDAELIRQGEEIADLLRSKTGCPIPCRTSPDGHDGTGTVRITDRDATQVADREGYRLEVSPESVLLAAAGPAGVFYGSQTLSQLLPPGPGPTKAIRCAIPAVRIEDQPRFRWRGLLLDCCRHFLSPEYIKRTIDRIAHHKMNRFHWHLTEDQGWRVEIDSYPRLVSIGSRRRESDGTEHGGFYSKQTIREIVEHAARRQVTVVPEIEMPGHCLAALASYPQLSCTGGPFEVESRWGIFDDVYCAGNEDVFTFLEAVLDEILDLFPGDSIHIGGDECPKTRWRECPRCQQRIKDEGLRDERGLQSYFISRVGSFLRTRGRRLIGWDEILEGGLAEGAVVQSWRGLEGAIAAVRHGHPAIVSPTSHAYFDYPVGQIDLQKVYSFEPLPDGLTREEKERILGGECNMWTERAPENQVDSKLFPRLLAMAERLWSPSDRRDFSDFQGRVANHYRRLEALGVEYGPESGVDGLDGPEGNP